MSISYLDVFEIDETREDEGDLRPGDVVCTSRNHFPRYTVIAVHGDKVWLRHLTSGVDGIAPVHRCRKVEGAPSQPSSSPPE